MERLRSRDNNCTFELSFESKKKGLKSIIVVLLESEIRNHTTWSDKARYYLGDHLYFDRSDDKNGVNFEKVVKELRRENESISQVEQ